MSFPHNLDKNNQLEVLLSGMYLENLSIVDNTNIKTNVLVINQTDKEEYYSESRDFGTVRCISTKERGLSKSRNMALRNAKGKICLICDDDEVLSKDYEKTILSAFDKYKDAGVICFKLKRGRKKYSKRAMRIGYIRSLKIASWQIAFDRNIILENNIKFDEGFGSGTQRGSGEENIFLYDCIRKHIKVYFVPEQIGTVCPKSSKWFKGFDSFYFENKGILIRRLMGPFFGFGYCIYFLFSKRNLYRDNISQVDAFCLLLKGLLRGSDPS